MSAYVQFSAQNQVKNKTKNFTPRKFCAFGPSSPFGYAPEHLKKNWAFAPSPLPPPQKRSRYATGYHKTFASLYCQHARVKKSYIPGVTKKDMAKGKF